jgi:hypothetical protein
MKRRPGTKQAELLSKKWPIIRKATAKAQAAGLFLCRYVEFSLLEAGGENFLVATKTEEIDCLLYEVDPRLVDAERYHHADKLIGFPWCDISSNPQINAVFEEIQSGDRWIVTGVLSNDPIKAFVQCACTRWYDTTQVAVSALVAVGTGITANINSFEDDQLFWSKTTASATAQALTDSLVEVQQSILGPKLSDLAARADQRAKFVYSASIQALTTGASGGQISFQLQRSMELDGQAEVWINLTGAVAEISLAVDQDDRLTFSFTDTIEAGVSAGVALKYQLLAKRSDSNHGATLHAGDISPTVTIDGQFLYPLPEEVPGGVAVTTGTVDTVSAATVIIEDAAVSATTGAIATVSAIAELLESAAVSVISGTSGTLSATAEAVEDAAVSATTGTTETASASAELVEDAALSASTGTSATISTWIAENIYSAPPSTPAADELGLTYTEVFGTTVTIPAQAAGYPSVRFTYNAAISLLATGASGGLCTFQLQENVNGGGWADITGETATKEFTAQDQEERFVFALYAPYPTGINANEAVQLRVVAKTDTIGKEVEVHSSLIDPGNTAPTVFAEADFFFT